MEMQQLFIALGQVLCAILGAVVKWLNDHEKRPQRIFHLVVEMANAVLTGMLVYCAYAGLGWNIYLCLALAILIGNQGAKGLRFLGQLVLRNSGLKFITEVQDGASSSPHDTLPDDDLPRAPGA